MDKHLQILEKSFQKDRCIITGLMYESDSKMRDECFEQARLLQREIEQLHKDLTSIKPPSSSG